MSLLKKTPGEYSRELDALVLNGADTQHDSLSREAVRVYPNDAGIRFRYAISLLPDDPDACRAELRKAVDLAPEDPTLLLRAAWAMFENEDFETSLEWLQRAGARAPENFQLEPEMTTLAALFVKASGEPDEAEEMLRSAHAAAPDAYIPARQLAIFLANQARVAEALDVLQPLADAHPSLRRLMDSISTRS